MQKKKFVTLAVAILVFCLMLNFGCDKDSNTGPAGSVLIGFGSDYFPLKGAQTIYGKGEYQVMEYDSTGRIIQSHAEADLIGKGYIGPQTNVAGLPCHFLYGYHQNGEIEYSNVAMVNYNQSVIAFQQPDQICTILPSEIVIGAKWIINPFVPLYQQVTAQIMDFRPSYTNSAGEKFSNVIRIRIMYFDSATTPHYYYYSYGNKGWQSYCDTTYEEVNVNVDIYFAKGVGPVDIKVNQIDGTRKFWRVDSTYSSSTLNVQYYKRYFKIGVLGKCGRIEAPDGNGIRPYSLDMMNVKKATRKISLTELLFGSDKSMHHSAILRR
jgi:hypothetical protein